MSKLGIQSPGATFASGAGAPSQGILSTQPQGPKQVMTFGNFPCPESRTVKEKLWLQSHQVAATGVTSKAGHEAHGDSLLSLPRSASSRPIMSTGVGVLSTTSCSQFTPSPVLTATTTSTVTFTTPSASVSAPQWGHHYTLQVPPPQGGRFSLPGPQLDFSQPADSLTASTTSSLGSFYQGQPTIPQREQEVGIPLHSRTDPVPEVRPDASASWTKVSRKRAKSRRYHVPYPVDLATFLS